MWKQKLGISLGNHWGVPTENIVRLVKEIGFDAISPVWESGVNLDPVIAAARECGATVQSMHGPVRGAANIWSEDPEVSEPALRELLDALEDCRRFGIPVMVLHTWIGYVDIPEPTQAGLDHYEKLVSRAAEYGVRIAFENAEGEGQLEALMRHFRSCDTVGFCWDSGHEMCYNHSRDMLAKYGNRMIMLHLNDNLGCSNYEGKLQGKDDLHLLPFDGVGDWDWNVKRLCRFPIPEYLNFEVKIRSKPGRYESLPYEKMSLEEYFAEAYKRACRVAYKLVRGAEYGTV